MEYCLRVLESRARFCFEGGWKFVLGFRLYTGGFEIGLVFNSFRFRVL